MESNGNGRPNFSSSRFNRGVVVVPPDEAENGLDMEEDDLYRPAVRRQNTCFVVAFVSLMIIVGVLAVFNVYSSPTEVDVAGEIHEADGGVLGTNVYDKKKDHFNWKKKHDEGFQVEDWVDSGGKVPRHHGKNKTKDDKGHHSTHNKGGSHQGAGGSGASGNFDMAKWLSSTVTLADGPKFEVVRQLQHDKKAFLEGLTFYNGYLWESTGLEGRSTLRQINKNTGEVLAIYQIADEYFGEGFTVAGGYGYQLTYKAKTGFKYDMSDLDKPVHKFNFDSTTGEGWGLTYDPQKNELIMSDGSEYLHFWDPNTLVEKRKVKVVRQNGQKSDQINELEFWNGRILANVWYQDCIIVIHPETGKVEKEYDFSTLYPLSERKQAHADVLNGISASDDPGLIYVTGKLWDRMFLVRLDF